MAMTLEHQQTFNTNRKRTDHALRGLDQRGIGKYLSKDQLELLMNLMQIRKIDKGSYLVWEGDDADKLYYIVSGQVKLLKSNEDGKDLILSIQQKGDLIAQFNGFSEAKYGFSAEVICNSDIGVILRKDLEDLLLLHPDLALKFLYWTGLNNQIMETKMRDLLLYGKAGALASTLIRMSNTYGVKGIDGSIHIQLKLTNTELGELIGCTRESINRMLGDWKNDGTIEMESGKLIIRKMNNLRDYCKCPNSPNCPAEICRL